MKKPIPWRYFVSFLVMAVLLTSVNIGAIYAKYTIDKEVQGNIILTADLGQVSLLNPVVSHLLIPGYDFIIENAVEVSQKSSIAAYVYVEVCDNFGNDGIITYTPSSNWTRLDGATGNNGGAVYYYNDPVSANCTLPVNFEVIVSQDLKDGTDLNGSSVFPGGSVYLNFYAYMAQTAAGTDPLSAYENTF